MTRIMMFLLVAGSLALGACNTFHGMGRDLQSAGNWMSGHSGTDHSDTEYREYHANDY